VARRWDVDGHEGAHEQEMGGSLQVNMCPPEAVGGSYHKDKAGTLMASLQDLRGGCTRPRDFQTGRNRLTRELDDHFVQGIVISLPRSLELGGEGPCLGQIPGGCNSGWREQVGSGRFM
jgi:hypothetical protein